MPLRFLALCVTLLFVTTGCGIFNLADRQKSSASHPQIQREFRAAWVATVANINWPSQPGLPVEQQKLEALHLLDLLQKTNFNAVIFQVRPQADAIYESDLEPWSYYLTGTQGIAPDPYYDPLEFWIKEAHKRNLELHVWLNPYRAHHTAGGPVSDSSVVRTKNELVVPLKTGYWWFDPGLEGTQDHAHAVVMDIVKRYDIDGVHFDDYFYPYPSYNEGLDFPDQKSWEAYQTAGGKLNRDDWRRNSVNTFIKRVYTSIKKEKPYVKFGISPFGIWRPGHPASIHGFDQYEVLYADAKKWLNKGWVDYFTPQLYWPVNQVPQSFPVLLDWWTEQNYENRHVWPGMSIGRLQGDKQIDEVINEIMITRGIVSEAPGAVHWSIQPLVNNDSLRKALVQIPYAQKVLVPPMNWLSKRYPSKPDVTFTSGEKYLNAELKIEPEEISNWVLYTKYNGEWKYRIMNKFTDKVEIPVTKTGPPVNINEEHISAQKIQLLEEVQITVINRAGLESRSELWPEY